ncbi:ubiquitin-binding ESCRT-I subunit protein MVB12 NDAI_0D02290 [Naumovozyma dairenensis CBS 421]|uniref:Multivesicular body sorting factor 12 domain-containing protein n=1 Tax=Naumovozyma dairenensis (strain ATCC 10597 / BCRC 20456 / CBS 421 / NBRC 0211 / NRRL Y-12639) TaxID=1071378 RepID=G0W9T2_NAUDC|nr:hypothetical protein NDAI_0D02290 [Naumovozyma dairenensis CBS 421]CCD24543.1 hypothetical protein NDAI_0D02290 [Naumovozyma dairenensis CBS 421]
MSEYKSHELTGNNTKCNTLKVEEILRKIPLYNKYGEDFPKETLQLMKVPEFKYNELQPTETMFKPWYEECDNLVKTCEQHDKSNESFDNWLYDKYLKTKPPGMMGSTLLSPSKRG